MNAEAEGGREQTSKLHVRVFKHVWDAPPWHACHQPEAAKPLLSRRLGGRLCLISPSTMLGAQRRLSRLRPLRRAFGQVQQVPSLLVRCLKLIKLPAAPLSVRFRRAAKPGRKNTSTIPSISRA